MKDGIQIRKERRVKKGILRLVPPLFLSRHQRDSVSILMAMWLKPKKPLLLSSGKVKPEK